MIVIEQGFETEMTDLVVESGFHTSRWTIGFGGSISSVGPVKNGILYFGACDNYIYAINAKTGKLVWRFKAGGVFGEARPAIYGNLLFLGNYDGYMYVVDIEKGELMWRFKTGDRIIVSVFVKDETVYFGSWDGYLYALNLLDGSEKWRFRAGDKVSTCALVYKDRIYFGCFDGNFYCLDKRTGKEKWRFKTGGFITTYQNLVMYKDRIFFPSYDKHLYCIDTEGNPVWKFRTGGNVLCSPCISDGIIYFGSHDNYFYAVDAETGREIWRFRAGHWVGDVKPVVVKGVVYFGSVDGNFYALDSKTGGLLWKFRTGGGIWSDSVFYEDSVIFGSWDCHVYAVDARKGNEKWRFETSTKQQAPLEISDEVIVRPEFIEQKEEKRGDEKKYETPMQLDFSPSLYASVIEYAAKDIYGAGKKKYEQI